MCLQFLLSSSVDETVRLWRVGSSDECLGVFSHKSFGKVSFLICFVFLLIWYVCLLTLCFFFLRTVTCVAFNPVDDNYFISGSTDGKVRIWDVSSVRVVDYTDVKEIVTALCYRPDAKGVVVGSMTGDCLFYHTIGICVLLPKIIYIYVFYLFMHHFF